MIRLHLQAPALLRPQTPQTPRCEWLQTMSLPYNGAAVTQGPGWTSLLSFCLAPHQRLWWWALVAIGCRITRLVLMSEAHGVSVGCIDAYITVHPPLLRPFLHDLQHSSFIPNHVKHGRQNCRWRGAYLLGHLWTKAPNAHLHRCSHRLLALWLRPRCHVWNHFIRRFRRPFPRSQQGSRIPKLGRLHRFHLRCRLLLRCLLHLATW